MTRSCRLLAAVALLALLPNRAAHAQELAGRVALEGIASVSTQASAVDDPMIIVDLVSTVRLADGWDVVVRPWSVRRPGGEWMFEMYQLQLRYVSSTRVPFRVDAGILPSPVGLFTLELQPHRNPLVGAPSYYFAPLPAVDGQFEGVRLISGGYPVGAMFSVSGTRWDARAGVTDSSPAYPRNVFSRSRPLAEPQLVAGGGLTPVPGLRLGAGFTRGRYRPRPRWMRREPRPCSTSKGSTRWPIRGSAANGSGTGSIRRPARGSRGASTCRLRRHCRLGSSPPCGPLVRLPPLPAFPPRFAARPRRSKPPWAIASPPR